MIYILKNFGDILIYMLEYESDFFELQVLPHKSSCILSQHEVHYPCDYRGCVHPGCRLRASGIWPIPCAHALPKSPLRASVKTAFLVARIGAQNDLCVHPFQKWPLRASISKSLKTNIWIRTSENSVFTTGVLQQRMTQNADNVRIQVAWGLVPVDCKPPNRQWLDNGTLWLLYETPGSKNQSLGFWIFSDS